MLTQSEFITQIKKLISHLREFRISENPVETQVLCKILVQKRKRFFLNTEIYAISSKGENLIKPFEENMRFRQDCLEHSMNWKTSIKDAEC